MDASTFLEEFELIINAPRGPAMLRQMIYQLAVTGRFSSEDDGLSDADELLAAVEKRRLSLIQSGQYKRLPKLEAEAILKPPGIELPTKWRWTRLLDVGEINPRNSANDSEWAAFLPMSGVPQNHGEKVIAEPKRWGEVKKGYTHFAKHDVILAKITPCFENGKAAVIGDLPKGARIGAGSTEFHVFRSVHLGILPEFVYLFLRSPLFTTEGETRMTGTAGQKRLPTEYFATRAFPLPPTHQQIQIVAKVNELLALCDLMENQLQESERLRKVALETSLDALANTGTSSELQVSWTRVTNNFSSLLKQPEDVNVLRSSILQLAVRGEITTQIASEGSAESEVAKIKEIANSLQGGHARRAKVPYRPVSEDELEFTLPKGWTTARLGQLVRILNGRA